MKQLLLWNKQFSVIFKGGTKRDEHIDSLVLATQTVVHLQHGWQLVDPDMHVIMGAYCICAMELLADVIRMVIFCLFTFS